MDDDEVEFELETVEVGPYTFEVTTVAHLPIEKLMVNHAKGVEISGQKVWCGSLSVAQYLLMHPHLTTDRVVVELGAGTGVLGMLCRKLGCSRVALTDNDPQSLLHMQSDCPRNFVDVDVVALDWFHPDVDSLGLTDALSTPAAQLLVVAGDVLYKHALVAPFFTTARHLLQLKGGSRMLLCHVPRAGVEQEMVVAAAVEHGLCIAPVHDNDAAAKNDENLRYCPEEDISRSQLYSITLSEER